MYIFRLTIKNYRNFDNEFKIDLKPFTLLIGENNIGKTNLLNAIGLIFSQDITFFKKRNLEIDDINYKVIEQFKKSIADNSVNIEDIQFPIVEVSAHMKQFTDEQESIVSDWFINEDFSEATITYRFEPKEDLSNWIIQVRERITEEFVQEDGEDESKFLLRKTKAINFPITKYGYTVYGGLNRTKQIDFYFLKMLKYEFLDAIRDVRNQLIASRDYRLLYKILTNRGENKYKKILDALSNLENEVENNEELKSIEKEIGDYLKKTSLVENDLLNKVKFSFSQIEESDILKKLSLLYADSPISVERNGTGRNNLLYISLLLSHLINSKKEGVYFRLIAIEEPEAHLHPHLQEHLSINIENEQSPNLQLILTSHSTHITSKLSLDNTVILFSDNEKIKSHYVLDGFERFKNGKLKAVAKSHVRYLQRFLDATKSTLFFARKVILVEGIAEQILLPPFFIMKTGLSLEQVGISVICVNGVAFSHFLELLKNGYFIKCVVYTDSDSKTQTQMRAIDLKEKYDSELSLIKISEQETFEKDLIQSNNDNTKSFLFRALLFTRKNLAKIFYDKFKDSSINTDEYFELIEAHKADFATNLKYVLNDSPKKGQFNIPQYILDGFEHIYPTK